MLRVTVIESLDRMVVARQGGWTLVCIPPVMRYQDSYDWSNVLYTDEEAATFRAYYGVPARDRGAGWCDVLPPTICGCLVPEPLRLLPWPPCPLHDGQGVVLSVVEAAERLLRTAG